MTRPLTLLLAAAVAAGSIATGAVPAAADGSTSATQRGIVLVESRWREDDGWRWNRDDRRHRHRHHRHNRYDPSPGFSFNFGPYGPSFSFGTPRRDCYRAWNGAVYCRR